jgi:hypothetical protein
MLGGAIVGLEHPAPDVGEREQGDRVTSGFVQEQNVLAVGDPFTGVLHAHPAPQGFRVQQSFGQWVGGQESAHGTAGQRSLLPGQSHRGVLS